jgi:hypothetical protein
MLKSEFAIAVDEIQRRLKPLLNARGFKSRGRSFNLTTEEGLTHVIGIQMGRSDPPGTVPIPGFRSELHGLFTINLGIYVPEVHQFYMSGKELRWVQEYNCCIRARLGNLIGEGKEVWWHARADEKVTSHLSQSLEASGFKFLEEFGTRDKILLNFDNRKGALGASNPPRIVKAVILTAKGEPEKARLLLHEQWRDILNPPGHSEFVRELARRLGLGEIEE